jgi:hypothetical protein
MLELGIRATVHSADPAYFRDYITENFVRTQEEADLGRDQVVQLSRNAFESSWLPLASRNHFLAELNAYAERQINDACRVHSGSDPRRWTGRTKRCWLQSCPWRGRQRLMRRSTGTTLEPPPQHNFLIRVSYQGRRSESMGRWRALQRQPH